MITKEIKKTVYETIDGQQFDTESEAKEHEIEIFSSSIPIKTVAATLKNIVKIKNIVKLVHLKIRSFMSVSLKENFL